MFKKNIIIITYKIYIEYRYLHCNKINTHLSILGILYSKTCCYMINKIYKL